MKKLATLILVIVALVAFPAVPQAKAPAGVEIALDNITFADTTLQVKETKKGLEIRTQVMVGEATLRCVEGPCDSVDGKEVVIRQGLRINIDHTSAGLIANGGVGGTIGLPGGNSAKFVGKVSGRYEPVEQAINVDIVEVCKMTSYLNDRIRELNKFQLNLSGSIVRAGDGWQLVGLTGTGVATGVVSK